MATINIQASSFCSGGGHAVINVTGDKNGTYELSIDKISSQVTQDDVERFLKVVCRLAKTGRSKSEFKTLLQSGINITL